MAEPSTNISYRFEDIQRYLQGKMSSGEMHDIEKAALQDPFLADAIEGYNEVDNNTAQQDILSINAKIINENKKLKVVSFKPKPQWLRVAALIIILAGIGVISSYFFKNSNQQQQVAQLKTYNQENRTTTDSAERLTSPNSIQNEEPAVVKNNIKSNPIALSKNKNNNAVISADKNVQANEQSATTVINPAPVVQDVQVLKSFATDSSLYKTTDSPQQTLQSRLSTTSLVTKIFAGKVVDEDNKPIAGAVVQSGDKQKAVITDFNGSFVLQKNDSLLNVTAGIVGYETERATLQTGNTNLIKLKENTDALNDVVVTGYGVQKRKSVEQSATPVGGWQNFNDYVITQLNSDTTNEHLITGKDIVELEFFIDNQGTPYNIKVVKSVDVEKNSKAIDIIKTGPKWTNTSKNKKGKVAIQF